MQAEQPECVWITYGLDVREALKCRLRVGHESDDCTDRRERARGTRYREFVRSFSNRQ